MKMKKKIILISSLILLIIISVCFIFLKNKNNQISLVEVKRGDIVEKVFESGQVRSGEKINLSFKNSGQIQEVYVQVGEEVEIGQPLIKLDTTELEIQLQQARLSLESAQLNLAQHNQITLVAAQEELETSYNSALTILDAAYPQIYNTSNFVKTFVDTYIATQDDDARRIIELKNQIKNQEITAQALLNQIKQNPTDYPQIENALATMKNCLEITFNSLETMRKIINDSSFYRFNVSTSDQNLLETYKTNINGALNQVINLQQTIATAKTNLKTCQTNIDLYQIQIKQAEAQIALYENQIKEAVLVSPIKGTVVEINKKVGEFVQPLIGSPVIVILPKVPYEVKVDIYEENIVKVKVGNPVEISLISFPNKIFKGKVISINPAEKIIQDVVYYEVIIGFEEFPEGIKSGMTADVAIQTNFKKDVLVIPKNVIQKKENKNIVKVLKNGSFEEKEVIIGVQGVDDMVEVISGLTEGEKVIKP
ncbi:MAG: efflux RND transporter periplasmic adaptor subunit [Minisyncoccales bacterium]